MISFSSDWLYPPYQSQEIVRVLRRLNRDVAYSDLQSNYGHDAFLVDVVEQTDLIRGFLKSAYQGGARVSMATMDQPTKVSRTSLAGRTDFTIIGQIIEPRSKVLDLGCGEGELLAWLAENKSVSGAWRGDRAGQSA